MSTSDSSINNVTLLAPKHFTTSSLLDFINQISELGIMQGKIYDMLFLDLSKVKQASMFGTLIVYKFMEFSSTKNCFNKAEITLNEEMSEAFYNYGFQDIIQGLISQNIVDRDYMNLKVSVTKNFIIAPTALLRDDDNSKQTLHKTYLPQIQKYYDNNDKITSMIFLAFSEILLNFWEHAIEDTKSIIVANGNKNNIEIACADTGDGIITTLKAAFSLNNMQPNEILEHAMKKGITSKKNTNHMGYGLWILDQLVTKTGGRLNIYSQGAYYFNEKNTTDCGLCGFWPGTIIFLSLPLKNPMSLTDIIPESQKGIKINWS